MTEIKVCGVRSRAGCNILSEAGVLLAGFNFWPHSRRYVEPLAAQLLLAALPPPMTRVGLFVDPSAEEVRHVLSVCELDLLQFHGNESPAFCRAFGMPFMKAFRLRDERSAGRLGDYLDSDEHLYLVDAWVANAPGGTGQPVALELARLAAEGARPHRGRLVLAGGMTPSNVGAAIAAVRPWAVDVASGVESSPGIQVREAVRAFVSAVRAVDSGPEVDS